MDNILWDELCMVIGTKEHVYVRRKRSSFMELMLNNEMSFRRTPFTLKESGSRAEGLSLPDSDIDSMCVDAIPVLPPTHPICQQADLIMDTEHLKPGFALLHVTNYSRCMLPDSLFSPDLVLIGNSYFLSSILMRDSFLNDVVQKVIPSSFQHGPCSTFKYLDGVERDVAYCLICKTWPDEAAEWIQRYRPNNWPTRELIQDIVNDGCLLVPIGNPQSEWSHLEWRISFSLAEKKLVYSMNHTEVLCYGFLKLFIKGVFGSDILCSYFLKTCLFYSIEDDNVIWQPSNIINCLLSCFYRLQHYVREGCCPNYFIKANNMFEGKLNEQNQAQLLAHLSFICQGGLTTFITGFCSACQYSDINAHTGTRQNECRTDLEVYGDTRHASPLKAQFKLVVTIVNMLEKSLATLPLDILFIRIYLYKYRLKLSLILYQHFVDSMTSNKKQYRRLKLIQNILHMCKGQDICTSLLHYATLCYNNGQFSTVICVVNYLLGKFKPYTLYCGFENVVYNSDAYSLEVCGRGLTYKQKLSQAVSQSYIVTDNSHMCPCDIETEVNIHSCEDIAFIPPIIYSNVLLFLSYKELGYTELQCQTLNELYIAAYSEHFVSDKERPLALALLDKCVQLNNE